MPRLTVFNLQTVDGYFTGPGGDISWHQVDPEFQELAEQNVHSGRTLVFGRVTYELMAGYWPSPQAAENDPVVAAGMNQARKIVFSRTLTGVDWAHTTLIKDDMLEAVRRLKREPGPDMTVLGSGSVVAQLAQAGLIDSYQILLNPVVLGRGRTMFEGLKTPLALKLTRTRTFGNGNILMHFEPAS